MRPAIRVDGLSKLYRIGTRQQAYHTLRESISEACLAGWQRLRRSASRAAAALTTTLHGRPAAPPPGPATDGAEGRPSQAPRREGDQFWALKDVSFEVQPGEVVGIIGRNGAGKSTLLKILSRITEPTAGRVELRGRVGSLLEVGTGFHPELTGRENIYLNGSLLGMSRREIERKFDEIVDFSGVEEFLDTPVKRYSSGMYVRLAFAVAAHLEPEILIVDEVLAVGDAEFQKKCLGKMQTIAHAGRTVLFVSHNMSAIRSLCRQALVLIEGKSNGLASADEQVAKYLTSTLKVNLVPEIDLRNLPRKPGQTPVFSRVMICDGTGAPTSALPFGDALRIRIWLIGDTSIHAPTIGVGIDDVSGQRALTVVTPKQNGLPATIAGSACVECIIDPLPLPPGRYIVKLGISSNNHQIDEIDQLVSFVVLETPHRRDGSWFHRGYAAAAATWSNITQRAQIYGQHS